MPPQWKNMREWEDALLATPLAARVSGEHDEHVEGDAEFDRLVRPNGTVCCKCQRCKIIRIKRHRAFRFSQTKCPDCGRLFVTLLHNKCEECREKA